MADPSRSPEIENDAAAGAGVDRGATKRTPRWVLVLGIIIAIALVVLMLLLHLNGTLGPRVH
jgi:hypothetical protein